MEKIDRSYLRKIRYAVQWGILTLIVYGGYRFYLFTEHFTPGSAAGADTLTTRPPLVDGFLPIGAFMSLKRWVVTGVFDTVHPAALVIFIAALALAVLLKKGFCGYVCPVGAISEQTYKLGRKIFRRNITLPRYIDYPLRSLKYLLMGFFIFVVVRMPSPGLETFLSTPYWKVADVKMLHFFTRMTPLTLYVLAGLFVVSLPIKNFWCRYLCPYGGLLGLLSYLSPVKITRNEEACIHCHRCTENCPQYLPVEQKEVVRSPECTGCLTCVSVCPAKGALDAALTKRHTVNPVLYIALVTALFFGIIGVGKITGHWHSDVTYQEYKSIVPLADRLEHP